MKELAKTYDPSVVEDRLRSARLREKIFSYRSR